MAGKYDAIADEFVTAPAAAAPAPAAPDPAAPAPAAPAPAPGQSIGQEVGASIAPPAPAANGNEPVDLSTSSPAEAGISDAFEKAGPAPVAEVPASKYDSVVTRDAVLEQPKIIAALLASKDADPKLYEKAAKLIGGDPDNAGGFGTLPAELVARNIDTFEKQDRLRKVRDILVENPQLADWLNKDANAKTVTPDELRHSAGVGWMMKAGGAALYGSWENLANNNIRFRQMMGDATPEDVALADRSDREAAANPDLAKYGADGLWQRAYVGAVGSAIPMAYQFGRGAIRGVEAGAAAGLVGAVPGAVAGGIAAGPAGALVGGAATGYSSAALGFTLGNVGGQYEQAFKQQAGSAWNEFRQMRGDDGRPMDPEVAKAAAMVTGAIEGAVNVYGIQKLIPGVANIGRETVKAALKDVTKTEAIKKIAKEIGGNAAIMTLMPAITELSRVLTGEQAKGIDGGNIAPVDAGEAAHRILEAAQSGGETALLMAPAFGLFHLPAFRADLRAAKQAEQNQTILQRLIAARSEDALANRLPQKAQELMAALKDGSGIEELRVPHDKLQEVFQSIDGDGWEQNLAAHIPDFREKFDEAKAANGDIAIPMEVAYAHYLDKYGEALAPHIRVERDGATLFEAQQHGEAYKATLDALRSEEATRAVFEGERGAPANAVFRDVRDQLMNAGMAPDHADHYATLHSAFFRVLGDKLGVDAKSLYDKQGLSIERFFPEVQNFKKVDALDVNLGAMQRFAKAFLADKAGFSLKSAGAKRQTLLDFIAKRGGVHDEAGDLRSRDAHLYKRGALLAKVDPETGKVIDRTTGTVDSGYRLSLDTTALDAWQSGFFPEHSDRPSVNDLLGAIDEGLAGNHRFNVTDEEAMQGGGKKSSSFNARQGELLKDMLERSPLTMDEIATLPIADLRAKLEQYAAEDAAREKANDEQHGGHVLDDRAHDPAIAHEIDDFLDASGFGRELFQFVGPNANGADLVAHERAKAMEKSGAFKDDIFDATGFFRGADGNWRFEISDLDATVRPSAEQEWRSTGKFEGTVGELINHPKLFAAYPGIADGGVKIERVSYTERNGWFDPKDGSIYVAANSMDEVRSILLHEIQHEIQDANGWAPGGAPRVGMEVYEGVEVGRWKAEITRLGDLWDQIEGRLQDPNRTPEVSENLRTSKADIEKRLGEAHTNMAKAAQFEFYQRIAGEVEARNVQKRDAERQSNRAKELNAQLFDLEGNHNMAAALRDRILGEDSPEWTQDRPNDQQIIVAYSSDHTAAHMAGIDPARAALTGTPEFKRWFGESKAVDPAGKPLVVFHGTNQPIEQFAHSRLGGATRSESSKLGFFFTDSRDVAEQYAHNAGETTVAGIEAHEAKSAALKADVDRLEKKAGRTNKPEDWKAYETKMAEWEDHEIEATREDSAKGKNIVETFLSLQNPKVIDFEGNTIAHIGNVGSFAEAIAKAKAEGHDGLILRNIDDTPGKRIASDHYVVFDAGQIKSVNNRGTFDGNDPRILYQGKKAGEDMRRGSLRIMDGEHMISLFEQADLSTFLHETGHFFLEVYKNMARDKTMTPEVRADWEKLSAYLGINGDEAEIPTVAHEKFARTFEAYLFEGKPPSAELATAFNRFKSWLGLIYKKITGLGVEPNNEIRGVMDRMLASEAEIDAQLKSPEYKTIDETLGLMNGPERKRYLELVETAKEVAREKLIATTLAEVKRETTKVWREEKSKVADEVREELSQMAVYQAVEFVRTGKFIGGDAERFAGVPMMKLDKRALLEMFGPGILQKLPKSVPPIYSEKVGVHPDIVAEMFGYKSGHAMVEDMMSAPPFRRAIVDETNARMKQRHGDLMNDQASMSAAAVDALHEGDRSQILRAEFDALSRKAGKQLTRTPLAMMRETARDIIGRKSVAEGTRIGTYDGQEARAARRVEAELLAGNFDAAAQWKEKQLFAHVLAQEARRAERDVQQARDYLAKFTKPKPVGGISGDYLEQIHGILERFDLRKISANAKDREQRAALQEFLTKEELAGEMLSIPDELKSEAFAQHFRDMGVDDFRALKDTIKNLEHVGRLKNKLIVKGKTIAFENARDEFVAAVKASQGERKLRVNQSMGALEKIGDTFSKWDAALLKIEQLVDWVDNGNVNGPFHRLVWEPIKAARMKEMDRLIEYNSKLLDVMNGLPKGRLEERFNIKSVHPDFHMTRAEIFSVGLNMGTESNLSKMKRGGNQYGEFTDAHLADMTRHLSKEDWQAIDKTWKIVGSLWPEIAAQQKRMTGLEPPKVEARKVTTAHGIFDGGYFPLVYDGTMPGALDVARRDEAKNLFPNASPNRPATANGFTKGRVENYARPIKLDLQVIPEHLKEVIHDLSFRETLRDAFKLLNDKQVSGEIEKRYGRHKAAALFPWLQAIAADGTPVRVNEAIDKLAAAARTNATIFGIGYRFSTIIAQISGLIPSMNYVSPLYLAKGMRQYYGLPGSAEKVREFVYEKSGEMRHREASMERDLSDTIKRVVEGKGVRKTGNQAWVGAAFNEIVHGDFKGSKADVLRFAFHGIGWMDRNVAIPTWLGAYHEHLSKNPNDEAGAVANGDRAVRLSQGSGNVEDLAAVSRGTEVGKMFTQFYSYWSAFYAQGRDLARDANRAGVSDIPKLMARAFFIWAAPAVMSDVLTGKGPDDTKDETWTGFAIKKILLYPLMAIPGIRDAAGSWDGGRTSVSPSAVGRVLEAVGHIGQSLGKLATGGEVERGKVVRHAIDATGLVFGLPLGQIGVIAQNIFEDMDKNGGQIAPRDLLFPKRH